MIRVKDYRIDFVRSFLAISNLEIPDKGVTLVTGDNGIGKTSFIRSILRINTEYTGKIFIEEVENTRLKRKEISRLISYLPQIESSIFSIHVKDFIKQGLYAVKGSFFDEVIDALDLFYYLERDYKYLSGGERQLVKIARSIIPDVPYTILDEPDTFLSKKNKEKVKGLIEYLSKKRGIIIVSHAKNDFMKVGETLDFEDFLHREVE